MFHLHEVNASNLKLEAGFPNIQGLVRNLPKIGQGLVHADADSLGRDGKLSSLAGIKAHGNMALTGIRGGENCTDPRMGGTWPNSGRRQRWAQP